MLTVNIKAPNGFSCNGGEAELNGVRKEVDANLIAKGIISEEAFEKIKEEMKSSGLVMQR